MGRLLAAVSPRQVQPFRTAVATVRRRVDLGAARAAFETWRAKQPPGSVEELRLVRRGSRHDLAAASHRSTRDEFTRLWLVPPSRWRSELDLPDGRVINIVRDGVWWSSHVRETWPVSGRRAQLDRILKGVGSRLQGHPNLADRRPVQPFAILFWPAPLLDEFSWTTISAASWLGRSVNVLRCKCPGPLDDMPLPVGADEYDIWLDQERGMVLRAVARSGVAETGTIELIDVSFDVPVDEAVFTMPSVPGV